MAYNGTGLFVIDSTGQPVAASTLIQASVFNALTADLATGLSTAITKDGQTTITANLPMAGYRHTGVGNASARTMYAAAGQVQDGALCYGTVGGTADAITLTLTPVITAYAAGQKFSFVSSGANTTAVTINVNSVGLKDVTKNGTTALVAGDIASGAVCVIEYDGTRFQLVGVVNDRLAKSGGNMTGGLNGAESTVASAVTPDIFAVTVGNLIDYTGTTTCTGFVAAPQAGAERTLVCAAAAVFTAGANMLIDGVTSGNNFTAAAGDKIIVRAVSTTQFRLTPQKYNGRAVAGCAQIQPIGASVASNALTISASALSLDFRSTTLGSGTVTTVAGTPSNLVVSSGSTLGTTSGAISRLAVLALNNAGTIELAVCNNAGAAILLEDGLISTTAEGGAGGADSANTVYSTTARTNVAYRIIGYVESTQATAGTWATAPSTIQGVGGRAFLPRHTVNVVDLNTANGYGSTNTVIRRFSNVITNTGPDITYTDSAANGGSFTINASGIYAITYSDNFATAAWLGISVNSNQLTTAVYDITSLYRKTLACSVAANYSQSVSTVLWLNLNDVVRAHTSGASSGSYVAHFQISRVG